MSAPMKWLLVVLGTLSVHLGPISSRAHGEKPTTGFIDKVYKGGDGYEAKYVVFIPHDYDGKRAYPLILYLHGSGQTGTDGGKQTGVGLGPAIKKQEKTFEFIAVFP